MVVQTGDCMGQSGSPVLRVHAYQRDVVPGIPPGGPPGGPPTQVTSKQYSVYLETAPNATLTVKAVWMDGKQHAVETAVPKSPVHFSSPVKLENDAQTLAVPATKNKVTEIEVKQAVTGSWPPPAAVSELLGSNRAVIELTYAGKPVFVPVKQFISKAPVYLP